MPRIFLDTNLKTADPGQIMSSIETLFHQLEDQVNAGTHVVGLSDDDQKLPEGISSGDLVVNLQRGELRVGIYNGSDVVYANFGSFTGAITDSQHGTRGGGTLHTDATNVASGFMSAGDKIKSNKYKGDTSSAAPASLTEFPGDGDWGYHTDTVGLTYKLAKNKGGVIYTVALV